MRKIVNLIPWIGLFLVLSYGLVCFSMIWSAGISSVIFFKISMTYAILAGILLAVYLVYREVKDEKQLKDDKYLD